MALHVEVNSQSLQFVSVGINRVTVNHCSLLPGQNEMISAEYVADN